MSGTWFDDPLSHHSCQLHCLQHLYLCVESNIVWVGSPELTRGQARVIQVGIKLTRYSTVRGYVEDGQSHPNEILHQVRVGHSEPTRRVPDSSISLAAEVYDRYALLIVSEGFITRAHPANARVLRESLSVRFRVLLA
jgi:hypothetical protein